MVHQEPGVERSLELRHVWAASHPRTETEQVARRVRTNGGQGHWSVTTCQRIQEIIYSQNNDFDIMHFIVHLKTDSHNMIYRLSLNFTYASHQLKLVTDEELGGWVGLSRVRVGDYHTFPHDLLPILRMELGSEQYEAIANTIKI
jgi:hypothetical protein